MSRYRTIDVRIHADLKYRGLSRPQPNGQSLWYHLLTGPSTGQIPGCYTCGEMAMAEELGWDLKGFREAFREVFREGMARADWEARFVWVPNAIRYNPPTNPNVVTSWAATWDELPECDLKTQARRGLKAFMEGKTEAFREAFAKACPKGLANQDQDQDQDQDQQQQQNHATSSRVAPAPLNGQAPRIWHRGDTITVPGDLGALSEQSGGPVAAGLSPKARGLASKIVAGGPCESWEYEEAVRQLEGEGKTINAGLLGAVILRRRVETADAAAGDAPGAPAKSSRPNRPPTRAELVAVNESLPDDDDDYQENRR